MDYKNEMYKSYDRPDDSVEKEGCYKECNFIAGVSVPLEIEPKTNVGEIEIECFGDPVIKKECSDGCSHKILITQNFFIKVPVCYSIKTTVGKCDSTCKDKKD